MRMRTLTGLWVGALVAAALPSGMAVLWRDSESRERSQATGREQLQAATPSAVASATPRTGPFMGRLGSRWAG
jgi:hypothetical protein